MVILTFQRSAQLGTFGKNIKFQKKKKGKKIVLALRLWVGSL